MFAAEQASVNPPYLEASLSVLRPYLWKCDNVKNILLHFAMKIYLHMLSGSHPVVANTVTSGWLFCAFFLALSASFMPIILDDSLWGLNSVPVSVIYCLRFKASHLIVLFLICNIILHFSSLPAFRGWDSGPGRAVLGAGVSAGCFKPIKYFGWLAFGFGTKDIWVSPRLLLPGLWTLWGFLQYWNPNFSV